MTQRRSHALGGGRSSDRRLEPAQPAGLPMVARAPGSRAPQVDVLEGAEQVVQQALAVAAAQRQQRVRRRCLVVHADFHLCGGGRVRQRSRRSPGHGTGGQGEAAGLRQKQACMVPCRAGSGGGGSGGSAGAAPTCLPLRKSVLGPLLAADLPQVLLAAHDAAQVGGCGERQAGRVLMQGPCNRPPQARRIGPPASKQGPQLELRRGSLEVTSLHALRPSAALVVAPAARLSSGAGVMVQSAAGVAGGGAAGRQAGGSRPAAAAHEAPKTQASMRCLVPASCSPVSGPRAPFTRSHTSSTLHAQHSGKQACSAAEQVPGVGCTHPEEGVSPTRQPNA